MKVVTLTMIMMISVGMEIMITMVDGHDVGQLHHGLPDWLYEGDHDDLLTGNFVIFYGEVIKGGGG